jgi:2-dehydro-3-deoxyphosphogluconate aldolase/(4S)-4-hydroxy-2-oxoglutarate aldolase
MLAGMGTILSPGHVQAAWQAGAAFGVSPGTNPRVLQEAQRIGLPFAPGIATPSDLEVALELGCREVKFFPAEPIGGLAYLKSLAAPYAHLGIRFLPLGGITADNLASYLVEPMILAVGGSWIAPRQLILDQKWTAITHNAAEAHHVALHIRHRTGEEGCVRV